MWEACQRGATQFPLNYRRGVDLHAWMLADLASMRGKLFDSVVRLVPTSRWHDQVDDGGSTIAGLMLHLARHQDLAVNAVIRNHPPLFAEHREALGLTAFGHGVGLAESENRAATSLVEPMPLQDYVGAVFDGTAEWLGQLGSLALDIEPNTSYHLTHRADLAADEFPWLYSMWEGKALWWFVQWPVIGHGHAHVGEATSIRNRMGLSPF